jgi:hypothetical protein
MPDHHWFLVQGVDDLGNVIGDLLQGLLGEDVRVRPSLARQHPEAMDEDDRGVAGGVGRLDLRLLPLGNRRHRDLPFRSGESQSDRIEPIEQATSFRTSDTNRRTSPTPVTRTDCFDPARVCERRSAAGSGVHRNTSSSACDGVFRAFVEAFR